MNYLFQVCMNCGQPYGVKPTLGQDGISHGYCPTCFPSMLAKARKEVAAIKAKNKAKGAK